MEDCLILLGWAPDFPRFEINARECVCGRSFLKRQPQCGLLFRVRKAGWVQLSPSSCLSFRTAMISQFFILSSKGDPLIYKDCILWTGRRDRGGG